MELLKQIQEFGLTEIEAKIYLSLLEKKEATVLELARNTGIKRATVHFNIENLISKGLVSQIKINNKRVLNAENPNNFKLLLDRQKGHVAKLENEVGNLIASLQNKSLSKTDGFDMNVKYFEGRDSVKVIYEEVLRSKEVRSYVNVKQVLSVFPENQKLFKENIAKNPDYKYWEIVEKSDMSEEFISMSYSPNYHFKHVPQSINLNATDVLIYDGKVAVISLYDRIGGMVLENKEYYEMSKNIFDFMWNIIPSI